MVVEKGYYGRLKKVVKEGTRGCVGACWIPDVDVKVTCADFRAFGVLQVE